MALKAIFHKIDKARFERKLRRLLKASDDFSPAFGTIGMMFRQSRKTIFDLKGPGGYPDFKTEKSKQQKIRETGFAYPLLFRYGQLRDSIINTSNPYNISIIKKKTFAFGTKLPYAKYHNSDKTPRRKIPQRKFIFWGAESRKFQNLTEETRTFQGRAVAILKDYIVRSAEAVR